MTLTIAIIGRPNVGKSTLFNRLCGKKLALVDNSPGLTRDRREGIGSIGPLSFKIIDTAGLEEADNESLEKMMMEQTERAVFDADIVLMVIDGQIGVTTNDEYFADWMRKKNKPCIPLVNKCEGKKLTGGIADSYSLGLGGEPVAISAEHGLGMSDLYDAIEALRQKIKIDEGEDERNEDILIAIAGRPNVGKSTLFNRLLGSERAIVSPVSGTTRDSIYVDWQWGGVPLKLVDTAGMRKKAKIAGEKAEKLAVQDSMNAVQYANVVIMLIDSVEGVDKQDMAIAAHVINEGRALIIAANKWDAVAEKKNTLEEINYKLEKSLSQAKGVPLITISALNGNGVKKIMKAALNIYDLWNKRISTGKLNNWFSAAVTQHQPPLSGGRRIRMKYITQVKSRPPTFAVFTTSNVKELPPSYMRYLLNSLREKFGFAGVPLRILLRKGKNPYKK